MGEKGGGPIYKQAPVKTGPQERTASPANREMFFNLFLNNISLNLIIQGASLLAIRRISRASSLLHKFTFDLEME
jgi:hypothetical protein